MDELRGSYRFSTMPSWLLALIGILGTALGFAIFILGAGLLLVLVPLLVIGLMVARWRMRCGGRSRVGRGSGEGIRLTVIICRLWTLIGLLPIQ